jgi:signal transduction histidine kinase/ActR/RegA family two-component response regulator
MRSAFCGINPVRQQNKLAQLKSIKQQEKALMIVKQLLGEILTKKGFLTRQQLKKALERQKELFEQNALPERLDRASLVSEARVAADVDKTPLLGKILVDMQLTTKEQVEDGLKEQEKHVEIYKSLDSDKLGSAIEVGSIVNSTLNLAEVLGLTMRYANRVTDSVASSLMLLDKKTGELVFSVPTGPKADVLTDIRIPRGKGIAGWVAQYEKPLLIEDAKADPRFYPEVDKKTGFETKSIVCVPLKAKKRLIGVLQVINRMDGLSFTTEDSLLLRIFANQTAMAIENARLYAELEARLAEKMDIQRRLAESEKFRALGQMASGMAHDFNNVLMGIQGNISLMLLEDIDSTHPCFEKAKDIDQYVISGSHVTEQLLQFAKGNQRQVNPTDMNALIDNSARLFGRTKKEIKIMTKCRKNLWAAEVNKEQIERVLLNLYVNAVDAMPGGGELQIRTENVVLDKKHAKRAGGAAGKYVKISIADSGGGMDQATRERIFEPFFTTKQMGRGTGLGLASAYATIRSHSGLIKVSSSEGRGTTFNMYLPASEKTVKQAETPCEAPLKGSGTVLLADDESMVVKVCKQMLNVLGYAVLSARSGPEALEVCRKEKNIDLIILNLMMPGMGGGEAYDRIKKLNPHAKILLASGFSVAGEAKEILARGCDGFIQKPFNINQLSEKVRGILEDKRIQAQKLKV